MDKKLDEKYLLLEEILLKLSMSQEIFQNKEQIEQFIFKVKKFYESNHRHRYSDIYKILNRARRKNKGNLEIINQNMKYINDSIQNNIEFSKEFKISQGLKNSLEKLYDHISLDIARFNEFNKMEETNNDIALRTKYINNLTNKTKDQLESTKKEYIAILGIFASIVLTFVANMALSSSVLSNIESVSIFKLLIITLTLGTLFLNMIYILSYSILIVTNNEKKLDDLDINIRHFNYIVVMIITILAFVWEVRLNT